MRLSKSINLALAIIFIFAASICAQPALEKRHQVGLRVGMWNLSTGIRTEISAGSVETSVGTNGGMGGVFYGYYMQENLALNVGFNSFMGDVETRVGTGTVTSETATITAVLLGLKYYPIKSTLEGTVRPYVGVSAGPYIGSQSKTEVSSEIVVESRTETAFGGKIDAGVDFILGRHFMLGVGIGYNLMSEFDQPIGGSQDYSGGEFALGISYIFGG